MKKKKHKVKEGSIFAVPLLHSGYVIGLIAREHKKITLGYFFANIFTAIPEKLDISEIGKWKVALIGKFSPLAIEEGEWPLLETDFKFRREDWPIPVLKMQEPITEQYFAVLYDDTLVHEERHKITKEEADKMFGHGNYGYVALQKLLTSILVQFFAYVMLAVGIGVR